MKKPVLLSVLLHLILALIFIKFAWKTAPHRPDTFITLESIAGLIENAPEPEQPVVARHPTIREATMQPKTSRLPQVAKPVEQTPEPVDSSRSDSTEQFSRRHFFIASPFVAFKKPLDSLTVGSTDSDRILPPSMGLGPFDSNRLKTTPGPYDPVQRIVDRQNRDATPTLPLGQALYQGASYLSALFNKNKAEKPVRFDSVPSEAEIEVFRVLWQKPQARDHEIYTAMDSSIKMTAFDLNRVLTRLTEKGMLKRKIVSPQNEFMLPLGKVEMSAKNRRNRVYEYETRVKPQELLMFLQAVLYEKEHSKNATGKMNQQALSSLRDKILKVASQGAKD